MATPKIEVEIGANISQLNSGFKLAENALGGFINNLKSKFDSSNGSINSLKNSIKSLKSNLEGATDIRSISQYNIRIERAETELNRLTTAGLRAGNALQRLPTAQATQGIQRLGRATSSYNGIGIEFSRIIQDAPFGIIGIGNNITQLAGNFQQLRASSTSTGAALKTAFASIISPANLLVLGISVLTSVLTVLSAKGFFKSKESAEDAAEALDKYREALDGVTLAGIKGQASATKEAQNFELLRLQAENANVPLNKRIEAVNELQKDYPEYLGNLTKEQILTGDVGGAYGDLTKSIVAKAKAQAFSNAISENALKLFTLENKAVEKQTELEEARLKVLSAPSSKAVGIGQDLFSKKELAEANVNKILKEQANLQNEIGSITSDNTKFIKKINEELQNGAVFTKELGNEASKILTKFEQFSKSADIINEFTFLRLTEEAKAFNDALSETARLQDSIASISESIVAKDDKKNADIKRIEIPIGDTPPITEIADTLALETERIQGLNEILSQSFSGLGNQIANSLNIGNDALKGFIGTLLSNTPKIIQAIFKQAAAKKVQATIESQASLQIATGNAVVAASSAAASLGPVGLALLPVFVGGAIALISSAFGKGGGGGGGGSSIASGSSGSVGQNFGGAGFGSTGNGALGLSATVRGTDLVFVIEETRGKNAKG
jgi:hypothetical protein